MSLIHFDIIYELDKKKRNDEEEKEFRRYLKMLRTYDLISAYNKYNLDRKIKEGKNGTNNIK